MKARAPILGDTDKNGPDRWEPVWHDGQSGRMARRTRADFGGPGATLRGAAENRGDDRAARDCFRRRTRRRSIAKASRVQQEHFGYTDGFGNPDFKGAERDCVPGQGKLTADGKWEALATGEFLLGYADEAGELPVAPVPHLLARNGTFMVYRKLHQNVATFRTLSGCESQRLRRRERETRGEIHRPVARRHADRAFSRMRPTRPSSTTRIARPTSLTAAIRAARVARSARTSAGCIRATRRVSRATGRPPPHYAPRASVWKVCAGRPAGARRRRARHHLHGAECEPFPPIRIRAAAMDRVRQRRASGQRQRPLLGNHDGNGKFVVQGTTDPKDPPFICGGLPSFVELRGGDYFFIPSLTALAMIATGSVDPR